VQQVLFHKRGLGVWYIIGFLRDGSAKELDIDALIKQGIGWEHLLVDLEDTGVGYPPFFILQLEGIEAAGEIAQVDRFFVSHIRHIFHLPSEEAENLQCVGLVLFLDYFEGDIGDCRVRIEFYDFVFQFGQWASCLAFSLGSDQ
jgi:hypothetical protein